MKSMFVVLVGVVVTAVLGASVGCAGPSAAQVKTAKLAEYNAQTGQLLDIAMQAVQKSYKIDPNTVDPQGMFTTLSQWYSSEGMRRGTSNEGNGDYVVNAMGGDIQLAMEVRVISQPGGRAQIAVVPHTKQLVAGSPQPRDLAPDDPNLPGWVKGRVDQLAVDIYNAAKPYEQKP